MDRFRLSKDSSQHSRNLRTVKVVKVSKKSASVTQSEIGKNKSSSSETRKGFLSVKQFSQVEILNPANVSSKKNSPTVIIENETSHVDILQRVQTVGVPKTCSSTLCNFSVAATNQQKLNQPIFQSSVVLMKNLETLKNLEIETRNLLSSNVEKDKKILKLLNDKVSTVLNPSMLIFSHLQPISFNVEQLVDQDETRLQNFAEKNAPQMRYKDPAISLADFTDRMAISKSAFLTEASFHDLCCQYQINPFSQHEFSDNLMSYSFWLLQ